jgi:hypothetical protein
MKGDTFAAALQLATAVLDNKGEVSAEQVAHVLVACYHGIEMAEQHLRDEAAARGTGDGPSMRRR